MKPSALRARRGFTLIELLLVIGIIAILASIVIVAINPTKQLGQARDAQRRSDVNTVLNAIYQYAIDNNGTLPSTISGASAALQLCTGTTATVCTTGYANLSVLIASGAYLVKIPHDPQAVAGSKGTLYFVKVDPSTKRVTVTAPKAEQTGGVPISVTR